MTTSAPNDLPDNVVYLATYLYMRKRLEEEGRPTVDLAARVARVQASIDRINALVKSLNEGGKSRAD